MVFLTLLQLRLKLLGKTLDEKQGNLVGLLDGYFNQKGHHLNVNFQSVHC